MRLRWGVLAMSPQKWKPSKCFLREANFRRWGGAHVPGLRVGQRHFWLVSFAELWAQERNQVSPDVVFALAQAAQRAADCAGIEPTIGQGGQGAPGGKNSGGSFALSATSLLFTPSPLLSLSIYAGALESYDDALVNASPVALVAVPDTCISVGGACVASPWPLSKCKGCEALVRGKTYTAFLLEKPGQLLRDVKRVPFVR
jgi:hypothetical protein